MKKYIFKTWLIIFISFLISGCSTSYNKLTSPTYQKTDSYVFIGRNLIHQYNQYQIKVISEPSGAKIELDNEFIGVTPFTFEMNGEIGILRDTHIIKANPVYNGQYVQKKVLRDPLPKTIFFNMNLIPENTNINLNVYQ